jgi:hypothetical protein
MGTVFRTSQQPVWLGPWIGVFLGLLGGCMWPLEVVPPFMKTLAHLWPVGYAIDAYLADLRPSFRSRNQAGRDSAVIALRSAGDCW